MAERRLKPGWKILGALLLGVVLWLALPPLLGGLEFFRIRQVEVRGLKNLEASTVVNALKLRSQASVFDQVGPLQRRVQAMPGVVHADVSRMPPGTLRVTVEEAVPVALVPSSNRLKAVDATGKVLPFDATVGAEDLPLIRQPDSLVTRFLARLQDVDATLYGRVVSGWRVQKDVVIQVDNQRYWFRPDATAEDIRAVTAVAQDLARKGRSFAELDGRFAGYVVVRWKAA
ncbi:MAG TPA: FtsQ-type POTRA domain-containing protein [Gemmatimonadales bacterium]